MNEAAINPEHNLTVLLHDTVAGYLRLVDGKLSFAYSPEYLQTPKAAKLSYSLPLQAAPFDEQRSKAFFGGLLPEGKLRTLLSKQFGVSKQNDFALLKEIGGECAGAVSLMIDGLDTSTLPDKAVNWLSKTELATLIEQLPQRPMMAGQGGLRLSLAGAQDKLPVRVAAAEDGSSGVSVGLPASGNASTFILKPPIQTVSHSVSNEFFCMNLSSAVGIYTPKTIMIRSNNDSVTFLLVSRYDREQGADLNTTRLHQEDFCQALGISSDNKYQNEGGPSLRDCFMLVRQATNNSATSILSLLDYVLFNTLVGNHDAHGKNFSLLYKNGKASLAPLYDCLSTAIYPTLTGKMAMSIGGKYKFSELKAKHWEQFALDCGLSVGLTMRRIKALCDYLPKKTRQLQLNGTGIVLTDKPTIETICQLIEQRCALTLKRLS